MDLGWKASSAIALLIANFIAQQALGAVWKLATGHAAPTEEERVSAKITEVIIFGILSGLLVALLERSALSTANKWYGGSKKDVLASHSHKG